MLQRLNSAVRLIQRTTPEAPQRRYVLHRTGCSQEDDQPLREGRAWSRASGREDRIDAPRVVRPLLKLSRETIDRCSKTDYALVSSLQRDPVLADRIKSKPNFSRALQLPFRSGWDEEALCVVRIPSPFSNGVSS